MLCAANANLRQVVVTQAEQRRGHWIQQWPKPTLQSTIVAKIMYRTRLEQNLHEFKLDSGRCVSSANTVHRKPLTQ